MTRSEYLIEQKEKGRRVFGIFPGYYPKEILWAMKIVPFEIWDPPVKFSHSGAHLQPYVCSIMRAGIELILQGRCDELDGFLFPHICDSVQNTGSLIQDYLGIKVPCFFMYNPRAPFTESSQSYYLNQLKDLIKGLENRFGKMNQGEFEKAIQKGREINRLIRRVYDMRKKGALNCKNSEFYETIRKIEYLWPDDYIETLKDFIKNKEGQGTENSKSVIMSGVIPPSTSILEIMDETGINIVFDDLISCSRRLLIPSFEYGGNSIDMLVDAYFSLPPCSTRNSSIKERLNYMNSAINETGARGIIFSMVKFCDPEYFDLPVLIEEFKRLGIPILVIEREVNQGPDSQVQTRIEAFAEMIDEI